MSLIHTKFEELLDLFINKNKNLEKTANPSKFSEIQTFIFASKNPGKLFLIKKLLNFNFLKKCIHLSVRFQSLCQPFQQLHKR